MDKEVENLLKNFRAEFERKFKAARASGEADGINDVELGRICLTAAAKEFEPLSPAGKKAAKHLAAYI